MDIQFVDGLLNTSRKCGELACGQCDPCRRLAMKKAAGYVTRKEEGNPKAALLDLLEHLGLQP